MSEADPTPETLPRPAWADEAFLGEVGLVARFLRVHLLFGRLLDAVTAAAGVSDTDYLALALIDRSPDGGSPTYLAQVLGRSSGGMTLTLDRLASMGWLTKSPDPADRRRVLLHLTPAGLDVVTRVRTALHAWDDALPLTQPARVETCRQADALLELLAATMEAGPVRGR